MSRKHEKTQQTRPKRSSAPTAARRRGSSAADLERQLDLGTRELNETQKKLDVRTRELAEAIEQQTAAAEVLRIISSSPGELKPIFHATLEKATRICEAKFGNLLLYDGTSFQVAAIHGAVPAFEELRRRNPTFQVSGVSPLARLVTTKQPQHIIDTKLEAAYAERDVG